MRAMVQHQSALWAPVTRTFSPVSTNRSPSSLARVVMFDRSLPAPASVYAVHTVTVPRQVAGTSSARCASSPNATTVGATNAAAVSMSGASWYAASNATIACQLVVRPPPPYSAGRLTPRMPASPAARRIERSNVSSHPVRSLRSS